jgi:hypothetical protein
VEAAPGQSHGAGLRVAGRGAGARPLVSRRPAAARQGRSVLHTWLGPGDEPELIGSAGWAVRSGPGAGGLSPGAGPNRGPRRSAGAPARAEAGPGSDGGSRQDARRRRRCGFGPRLCRRSAAARWSDGSRVHVGVGPRSERPSSWPPAARSFRLADGPSLGPGPAACRGAAPGTRRERSSDPRTRCSRPVSRRTSPSRRKAGAVGARDSTWPSAGRGSAKAVGPTRLPSHRRGRWRRSDRRPAPRACLAGGGLGLGAGPTRGPRRRAGCADGKRHRPVRRPLPGLRGQPPRRRKAGGLGSSRGWSTGRASRELVRSGGRGRAWNRRRSGRRRGGREACEGVGGAIVAGAWAAEAPSLGRGIG